LASAVLDPAVRRLLEQDDAELQATALAYLEAGGNVQETAAALNVHRQTVYYRVQKIEQITGLVLSRGDHRLVLHLGLTMAPFVADPG
jgi:DNA-binding PucR family transcriptional regulator